MSLEYAGLLTAVQHLAPTWRKTQQVGLAHLVAALFERPTLCLTELARAWPRADQPLHGRVKRLTRWLSNPRLDELALSLRWLKLSYHFGAELPPLANERRPLLPVLLDTTYFEPFACLLATVPCGSRGLPIALTTYHRTTLEACLPPPATWPAPLGSVSARRKGERRSAPAAAQVQRWPSQNRIEEHFMCLVAHLVSPALRLVWVMDRGFARAALFAHLQAQGQDYVCRIEATTHVQVTPDAPYRPAAEALALQPGERRWYPHGRYGQEAQLPGALLAVWDPGQEAPWYLVTTLPDATLVETVYRWRMRQETTHRDLKTGVLLREGDDHHALTAPRHLHRLLLALAVAEWVCALLGLQAWQDLPLVHKWGPDAPLPPPDPALPPPVQPHRPGSAQPPPWMRRFAVRGQLSYVRLGFEVLRAPDLAAIVQRAVAWLGAYLWSKTPLWRPRQLRYRQRHWWPAAA